MKNRTSVALLASVGFTLILCSTLPVFFDFKALNNFIFGTSLFTLMYSFSEFFRGDKIKFRLVFFSIPFAVFGTLLTVVLEFDNSLLNRITNICTLVTLGITIFLIAEKEALQEIEVLKERKEELEKNINDLEREKKNLNHNEPEF